MLDGSQLAEKKLTPFQIIRSELNNSKRFS